MTPERILIASPVRGGVSPAYVRNLTAVLGANWVGRFKFDWAATTGTSVAWARDELAETAVRGGFDRIFWWDIDILFPDPKVHVSAVARLLNHDVDAVAAAYAGHNPLSQFHGANRGEAVREDGLMSMGQIPIGFSVIKTKVFKKLRETHPWHEYLLKETGMRDSRPKMFEYFPTGVVGPNSSYGKIDRVKDALAKRAKVSGISHDADQDLIEAVHQIINDKDYSGNFVLGEDFYFCKNAIEAGFTLYIDNNMIAPHESKVLLPLQTQTLLDGLTEDWRFADNVNTSEVRALVGQLSEKMAKD